MKLIHGQNKTTSGTFKRNIIRLPTEVISPESPEKHNCDSDETTSDERSQLGKSGAGLPSQLTRSLCRGIRLMYQLDYYD